MRLNARSVGRHLVIRMRNVLIATALLLFAACHESGTWVDDPRNFKRAWGVNAPGAVQVVHSQYWRSAHFTREEVYYFQLRATSSYAEVFAAENRLKPLRARDLGAFSFMQPKPAWFAPKPPSAYQIWGTGSEAPAGFVLLDRMTGDIFIHVAQL